MLIQRAYCIIVRRSNPRSRRLRTVVGMVLVVTSWAALLPAQSARPSVPYVVHGACPFECCTYTNWRTTAALPVHAKPATSAPVLFRTEKGEHIKGDSGNVIVSRLGLLVARKPMKLEDWLNNEQVTTVVPRGDTVYVLDYQGEGTWGAWYDGKLHSIDGDWDTIDHVDHDPRVVLSPARLLQKPVSEWWAHITRRSGATGWVRMDSARVEGTDSCS